MILVGGRIVKQLSRQPYGIQPISLALSLAAGHAKARKLGKLTRRSSFSSFRAENPLATSLLSLVLVYITLKLVPGSVTMMSGPKTRTEIFGRSNQASSMADPESVDGVSILQRGHRPKRMALMLDRTMAC